MIDIVIAWDSTGSMYSCLHEVKRRVKELVDRIYDDINGARIALYSFGNHNDNPQLYPMAAFCSKSDKDVIVNYITNVKSTGGGGHHHGGCPACYELAMQAARGLSWEQEKRIMIMIGDEVPSHPKEGESWGRENVDWKEEFSHLVNDHGVHFYGVHCLNNRRSASWYSTISQKSDGVMVTLSQFSDIVEILHAICYKEKSLDALEQFELEIKSNNRMTRALANAFSSLSGKNVSQIATFTDYSGVKDTNLLPVDPSRFQVLGVTKDQDIKSFVLDSGASFVVGRGFYEWTKRETIQEKKEVVLVDKVSGDMWCGTVARDMIGLPMGQRGDLSPSQAYDVNRQYQVFIQSTSNNRKLMKGTKFLYEVAKK